jgi:uncharacterized protein DUF4338
MKESPAQSLRFCGRQFSVEEVELIRGWLAQGQLHRSALAARVCDTFEWINQAGKPKLMSCRVAMLRMERAGLLRLPPPRNPNGNGRPMVPKRAVLPELFYPTPVNALSEVHLDVVDSGRDRALYRHMMGRHHYLGDRPMAGAQMRYVIRSGATVLGGMGFGASAWSLAPRDRWLGWSAEQRQQGLHLIVNHSRFLLLPWVRSPNLASQVLAGICRQLPGQWQERYSYCPVLLESFVEQDRFEGACYKAANWRCLGLTQGRGKLDRTNEYGLPLKWIFVYPLRSDFIPCLYQ